MVMTPGNGAREKQLGLNRIDCSIGQSLPALLVAFSYPVQEKGREVGVKRKLVLRILGLHVFTRP